MKHLFLLTLFLVARQNLSQSIGETCIDSTNNLRGSCKILFSCPHVYRRKIVNAKYTRCGVEDYKELVCCAEKKITPDANPEPLPEKKSVQMCEKYKKDLFDREIYLSRLSANAKPIRSTISKCSDYVFPLVVGGENALPREFPHMGLLGCKNKQGKYNWVCGGSLISPNYILTAAHCFEYLQNCEKVDIVRLGDLNVEIETDDARPKDFQIDRIISHPQYNDSLKYNDIALVKLVENVEFNDYMRPACLPYKNYNNESRLIVTGWGSTQHAGRSAAHLQKAGVEFFDQKECDEIYNEDDDDEDAKLPFGVKERIQICAGSREDIKDTCQGDSGGPLQTVHPNYPCMYSIMGITSFGHACGFVGTPAIYTRVFNYIDWIESVVWN